MALPLYVGAGSGVLVTTGTGTVSKTGCTEGNLLILHILERGTPADATRSNRTNITNLAGTANSDTPFTTSVGVGGSTTSRQALYVARVTANGTCSWDWTVGASGNDVLVRVYEFSGGTAGTTTATVFENAALSPPRSTGAGTGTSVADATVTTNDAQRLALQFVALESNQAIGAFTGQTGGTWAEAVAEYAESGGATGTLQLQIADMPTADTIDGGTLTVSSIPWGVIGTSIIPLEITEPPVAGRTYKRLYGPAQLAGSAADLYTCPTSTVTRTLHIHASNPSGSAVDANLSIGTDAAGTRVWDDLAIPADGVVDVFDPYELTAGEKIQGWADTAGTVVVTITGYEDPV